MYKVMLVDDVDISLRQIKRMKLWNGETCFNVAAEASNGCNALEILHMNRMDLIITDIKMPKVDGIELLKEVMGKNLCPCVVLLSDYSDFTYAKQGIQYGAFDYLNKPAEYNDMKNLLDRVEQFLNKRSREIELVKNLEEKLEEKIENFFPAAELEQLIEAIKLKRPETPIIAHRLTDTIIRLYENDVIKIGAALKKAMAELVHQIRIYYNWLDKFIDEVVYKGLEFTVMSTSMEAADAFYTAVKAINDVIGRLEFGNNTEQLENRICRYVLERVDSAISIEGIARFMYMNRKYLSEVFRQKTGELLVEYITRVKMERAVKLLDHSSMKTYEIALLLGYKDTEYFSRLFKKHVGISPSGHRNSMGI